MIAQISSNKDGKTVYRYAETNLIFTIAEDEKLVHCFDIDEPLADILKFVPSMSAVLESHGVSIKDFRKDFGGRGLSLSDAHVMRYELIDSLKYDKSGKYAFLYASVVIVPAPAGVIMRPAFEKPLDSVEEC
ncbi:hypothetical protein [Yersinia kristensenii]|uniref:hypothetical protein n=1 Tax=Yersinia kristensenii TaxID=28152 RepID=UPI0011A76CDD|nr:hypothetical protein [Yersinia kristensenii]